jgi:hypothetical protein
MLTSRRRRGGRRCNGLRLNTLEFSGCGCADYLWSGITYTQYIRCIPEVCSWRELLHSAGDADHAGGWITKAALIIRNTDDLLDIDSKSPL